jgi:hypothetical protein
MICEAAQPSSDFDLGSGHLLRQLNNAWRSGSVNEVAQHRGTEFPVVGLEFRRNRSGHNLPATRQDHRAFGTCVVATDTQ